MNVSDGRGRRLFVAVMIVAGVAGQPLVGASDAGSPRYPWQKPHAKVLPNGTLEWAPLPFVFEKGASVRYIDYEAGDDAKDGLTPQSAWKHHPWDAHAVGQAKSGKGLHTYVFKGGVLYRGALKATESGTPNEPIRLTSDPAWGEGEALFYGSTQIKGGWKQARAEDAPGIPKPDNVWYNDVGVDYDPDGNTAESNYSAKFSAMWQVGGNKVDRLHIAREPNYDLSDPNNPVANWPTWTAYDRETFTFTSPILKGLGDQNLLKGAVVWSEGSFLMAAATKTSVMRYDPIAGSVALKVRGDYSRIPRAKVHFMVENVAKFLDAPGEFFFQLDGPRAGRLFLYPADGVDPNHAVYEVAQIRFPIWIADQSNIAISRLEFRYNDPDDGSYDWPTQVGSSPCVRIVGNCTSISVRHCRFLHVANAVAAFPRPEKGDPRSGPYSIYRKEIGDFADDVMDNIVVSDNDVLHAEKDYAISLTGSSSSNPDEAYGRLQHVEVLRNRVVDTGFRHGRFPNSCIPAIAVNLPETCEVAGNIVDTSFGSGIFTVGGKRSGDRNVVPLTRMLVHHNQIDNTMLGCNDYGGLEHFQGGPLYIYNNNIRNCVGNRTLGRELGYSIYLDGGFKCYSFNNIIAGNIKPDQPDYYNHCGYFMVFGFMNQFFNNTIYRFERGFDGSSGNRCNILGNLLLDCSVTFIGQNRPGDVSMEFGGDTGAMGRTGIPTMAYAHNVFFGNPTGNKGKNDAFGYIGGTSTSGAGGDAPVHTGNTLEELRDKLEAEKCRLSTIGWHVADMPLADPAKGDYRPAPNSGSKDRGVKYFVPWALARTVGEWNFYKSAATPPVVLGEGFYMTDEYADRGMYYHIPRNDLTVTACGAQDYGAGALEDWIEGALTFDGNERIASLSHVELVRSVDYPAGQGKTSTYNGAQRETLDMGSNNFLIEAVFKTGIGHTQGVIASKLADAGYALFVGDNGGPCLVLQAGGVKVFVNSTTQVNDGEWHHLLAEVDRAAGKAVIYVAGKLAGEGDLRGIAKEAALANTADFVVGQGLVGAVDFLRVCRSTLADSKTSIEELYAWEFNGPVLRDFCGNEIDGRRDAGAIEFR